MVCDRQQCWVAIWLKLQCREQPYPQYEPHQPDTAPAFPVQAEDDPVQAENSLEYYLGLRAARAPASEMRVYH